MRKELSHHTMSARSRTAAGPREHGWLRAVPEVSCERPLPNNPLHSRTRTRSFGLSRGLCSVSCMISVLCLAELLQCFSSHESCVTGCHSFPCCRIFVSTALHGDLGVRIIAAARRPCHLSQDTLGFIQVLHLARHTGVLFSSLSHKHTEPSPTTPCTIALAPVPSVSLSSQVFVPQICLARHTNLFASLLSMRSQHPRRRGAAPPNTCTAPFVTFKRHASSRLSGHRAFAHFFVG